MFTSPATLAQTSTQIDAIVLDEMAKQNIVGMAVGIVKDGEIYHARGYGHVDLARTRPVTIDTIFRWASISKTLTATAALKLAEENPAFSVNDKVTEHVPYWPVQGNKGNIRIKHLLSNRSGIIHYTKKKGCYDNRSPSYDRSKHSSNSYNAAQAVAVFKNQPLCFDPGSNYRYSTFGYNLLGSAIEGGTGTSYANWIRDKIKIPLGMSSLRQATGAQKGFDQQCHILREIDAGNAAWKLPGGGWESNILDMAKFAHALLHGSLLYDTSRLWTTVDGNPPYGYGIKYTLNKSEVWHQGRDNNSRALLYLYPGSADRLGIVLMINSVYSNAMRIAHHLANLFGRNHIDSGAPAIKTCEDSCTGRFSAVWRRNNKDVLLRRGYRHDSFFEEWKFLRRAGYYCDDFEPYVKGGKLYWDAIFRKGTGDNALWSNFDDHDFRKKWAEQSSKGYRLIDIETYHVDGKRYWAGLFRPGAGRYALYRGLSSYALAARQRGLAQQGYKLIDIEAYGSDGALNWAGVWRSGQDGPFNLNLATKDFTRLRHIRFSAGQKLIDIETYQHNGRQLWAGIWEKSMHAEKFSHNQTFCGIKNDADMWTKMGITSRHDIWREQAYELVDWEPH